MQPETVEIIKEFQTAIVGVIGFLGVIISLSVNARVSEANRSKTRLDKAKSIAVVLQAEIELLLGAVMLGEQTTEAAQDDEFKFPLLKARFSENVLHGLGELDPTTCRAVIIALSKIEGLVATSKLFATDVDEDYITISGKHVAHISMLYASSTTSLEEAIQALKVFQEQRS